MFAVRLGARPLALPTARPGQLAQGGGCTALRPLAPPLRVAVPGTVGSRGAHGRPQRDVTLDNQTARSREGDHGKPNTRRVPGTGVGGEWGQLAWTRATAGRAQNWGSTEPRTGAGASRHGAGRQVTPGTSALAWIGDSEWK